MAHQFETKLRRLERDLRYFKQQLQQATRQERIAILEQIRNVEQEILNTLNEQTAELTRQNENMMRAVAYLAKMNKTK